MTHACCPAPPPPLSCHAPQNVLSEEYKANEMEVGVVSVEGGGAFRVLPVEEVDRFLVAISERD